MSPAELAGIAVLGALTTTLTAYACDYYRVAGPDRTMPASRRSRALGYLAIALVGMLACPPVWYGLGVALGVETGPFLELPR